MAAKLVKAGHERTASGILRKAADAEDARAVDRIRRLVEDLCAGRYQRPAEGTPTLAGAARTFRTVAEEWTSGDFHRQWPDHVKDIDHTNNRLQLDAHVLPEIGDVGLADLTRAHCDAVMRALPGHLGPASRRHVAQIVHRVLSLSELAGYIDRSPLPRGWMPRRGRKKDSPILLPTEDAQLLGCEPVPVGYRLLYGFLHREGGRRTETASLRWDELDLDNEVVQLDENKTQHSRWWKMGPGVAEALKVWRELRGKPAPNSLVFLHLDGSELDLGNLAKLARLHLEKAGVGRARLFQKGTNMLRFGAHSFRHSFATRSLANGRTDDWVRQRTGHTSPELLTYREAARALEELEVGEVSPLVVAIPELAKVYFARLSVPANDGDAGGGPQGGPESQPEELSSRFSGSANSSDSLAEREGFEPSVRLPVHMISSHAPSATRSPLLSRRRDRAGVVYGVACFPSGAGTRRRERDSNPRYHRWYT